MRKFLVAIGIIAAHLIAFELIVRLLGLREMGFRVTTKELYLLFLCVPFAVPTVPAMLETRLLAASFGPAPFNKIESGLYRIDIVMALLALVIAMVLLVYVSNSLIWFLLAAGFIGLFSISWRIKCDLIKRDIRGAARKPLKTAVFLGNIIAYGLFFGAWFILLSDRINS